MLTGGWDKVSRERQKMFWVCSSGRSSLPPPHISFICLSSAVCQHSLYLLCFLSVHLLSFLYSPSIPSFHIFPALLFSTLSPVTVFLLFPIPSIPLCVLPWPLSLLNGAFLVFHSLQLTYWYFTLTLTPLPPCPRPLSYSFFSPSSFPPPFFLFLSSFSVFLSSVIAIMRKAAGES